MWTDFVYNMGEFFEWSFGFYEFIQNYFNDFLLFLGFFGFLYWMNIQNQLSKKSNVPIDAKENVGWYKNSDQKLK